MPFSRDFQSLPSSMDQDFPVSPPPWSPPPRSSPPRSSPPRSPFDIAPDDVPDDDTLGAIGSSPRVYSDPEPTIRTHHHSQSLDQGLATSVQHHHHQQHNSDDMEHQAGHDTPPTPQQQPQSISRPPSGLEGPADRHAAQYNDHATRGASGQQEPQNGRNQVVIKVGMVGDAQIGKTSLMVKYVEGSWDEDYIQTLGVNFMEKTISIRNTEITFSIWDLGGQREFVNMLPLVCNDAVAILFMFDLTRKSTLNSIKEWYRQGRGFNKTAIPVLVGTKYDHFVNFPREDQEEISNQVRFTLPRLRGTKLTA